MPRPSLRSARVALGWGLLSFVALQVGFTLIVDWHRPDFYDPEFGVRLEKWRALRRDQPRQQTLVMLGSSRCVMSFAPEELPPLRNAAGDTVVPFNFSHLAAGPILNLMEFRRMRRLGVRPDYLVVEIMPVTLTNEGTSVIAACMTTPDLPAVRDKLDPFRLHGQFLMRRLVPWYRCRAELLDDVAPDWILSEQPPDRERILLGPQGGDVGWVTPKSLTPEEAQLRLRMTRDGYIPTLQTFRIKSGQKRAFDDLLSDCRRDNIRVVLLLTPEGDRFRSWYPPRVVAEIDAFCADLSRRHGVPVIDARRWLAEEDFIDSHHTDRAGAKVFTRRLAREVLRPLVEGAPLAGNFGAATDVATSAATATVHPGP